MSDGCNHVACAVTIPLPRHSTLCNFNCHHVVNYYDQFFKITDLQAHPQRNEVLHLRICVFKPVGLLECLVCRVC